MNEPDYDDPDIAEHWCQARRTEVTTYLQRQGLDHGEIADWPAWRAAPHVSLWAIEKAARPGQPGWWVVCGDVPSDYIEAHAASDPRAALRAIGERWLRLVRGDETSDARISKELFPLLETRSRVLLAWAGNDAAWGPEEA